MPFFMERKNITKFLEAINNTDLSTASLNTLAGLKIQYIYLVLGYSQLDFSLIINTNISYLYSIMHGKKNVTVKRIEDICKRLHLDVFTFFDFTPLYLIKENKKMMYLEPYISLHIDYI